MGLKFNAKIATEVHSTQVHENLYTTKNEFLGWGFICSVYSNTVWHCCCTISSFRINEKRGIQGQLGLSWPW